MATICKETEIIAEPRRVWHALRDVGALHTRLAPGFVVDTTLETTRETTTAGNTRCVTFGNGMTAREDIVSVDDDAQRVAWAIVGQRFHHYNSAAQVFEHDGRTRFVWTTDLLPDQLAAGVEAMMDAGLAVIKNTLEQTSERA